MSEQPGEADDRLKVLDDTIIEVKQRLEEATKLHSEFVAMHKKAIETFELISKAEVDFNRIVSSTNTNLEAAEENVQEIADKVDELRTKALSDAKVITEFSDKAIDLEVSVNTYTESIQTLISEREKQFEALREKVEGLLPGATSAGLASAFEDRKVEITKSQRFWKWSFVITLTLSLACGYYLLHGYLNVSGVDWTQFLRGVLPRLVLLTPLLWFAGFSARQLSVRFRLEEDYAHKEVLSRAFEGYKREMTSMKETDGAAAQLASTVIMALGDAPVRLYDAKIRTDSPLERLTDAVGKGTREANE